MRSLDPQRRKEYQDLFQTCAIRLERVNEVRAITGRILATQDAYRELPLRTPPASHDPCYPIRALKTRLLFCFSAALLEPVLIPNAHVWLQHA
jgi:hypothetical protein